jgi:hypothetical protein
MRDLYYFCPMILRIILLIAMMAVLAAEGLGQAGVCTLTPETAPALFGFKLGMLQATVEKMVGEKAESSTVRVQQDDGKYLGAKTDEMSMFVSNKNHDSLVIDNNITQLSINFIDGKLFKIEMYFSPTSEWVKAVDPMAFFQKKFGIPADAWEHAGDAPGGGVWKTAVCNGVRLHFRARTTSYMRFFMVDTEAEKRVKAAQEAVRKPST